MKWIYLASACVGSGIIGFVVWTWWHADAPVSPDWLIDNSRRVWGAGVDQPCMTWPVKKNG